MKKRSALVATMLLLFAGIAVAQNSSRIKLNYGIKAGFQAVTYDHTDFDIEGYSFNDNTIQSNKVSYTVNPFIRLTRGSFYIQTEAALGITRHHFDFHETSTPEEGFAPADAEYNLTTFCFQVPLLVGYKFIDYEYYSMAVFTGPRAKFIFTSQSKQDFSHFKYDDLYEELDKRNLYWEFGLGVRMYNVFFDITYDWGLARNKTKIIDRESGSIFSSKRNDSILSFSVGFIF